MDENRMPTAASRGIDVRSTRFNVKVIDVFV